MSLEEYLVKELDGYTEHALNNGTVDDLQRAVEMRLHLAQARYYSDIADAMEQTDEPQEAEETADKYSEYIRKKKRYRETKAPESKQALSASLQRYLADVFERLSEIYRDSDCQEEREQARNFAKRLREVFL